MPAGAGLLSASSGSVVGRSTPPLAGISASSHGEAMPTKDEAHNLVVDLWREWPQRPAAPTGADMLIFFGWVQSNKPHVLEFHARGDKWQHVRGWLESYEANRPK